MAGPSAAEAIATISAQQPVDATAVGAGILWAGLERFQRRRSLFSNANAGAAVLNTNTCTACLLVWTLMDKMAYGKPSCSARSTA